MDEMTQYSIDQIVVHKREGLAKIVGIKTMGSQDYFMLHAKRGDGENIYVPVLSANEIIRPLMDKNEADKILKLMNDIILVFNPNTKQRRDDFKRRLNSGSIEDLVFLCKQLFSFKNDENLKSQIKLGQMDYLLLEHASNMLFDEFSISYNINRDLVEDFVFKRMKSL